MGLEITSYAATRHSVSGSDACVRMQYTLQAIKSSYHDHRITQGNVFALRLVGLSLTEVISGLTLLEAERSAGLPQGVAHFLAML